MTDAQSTGDDQLPRTPDRQADRRARTRARWVRWVALGVVLVAMTAIVLAHQQSRGAGRWAGVDFLCPFGGLETLYSLLSGNGFLRQSAASALILLIGMLVVAVVFRRSFCGMLCPLGTLQGIFGAAGRRLFGARRLAVPPGVDRLARFLKYGVFAFFLLWTWQAAELVMRPYDPWVAWAHLTADDLLTTYTVGFAILVVSLAGSLVYERFFCKYLCPAGALLGLLSRVSFLNIHRDATTCIDCGRCDKACMMNVRVATADVVTSSECISCNECVNACPVPGALKVTAAGVVLALMVGIVGVTTLSGSFDWQMEGRAEARGAGHGGQGEGLGLGEGQGEGQGGGSDSSIKGWMSFADIAAMTGIPLADFGAEWGVPADALGLPMKDVKDAYGFTPEEVRAWVEDRLTE
jgi:NAD-dependent dihydropyrimidine dehydrogenase PreA subunit